ncbi:MAG: D-glycero-beta-D-manno-heptose 1,7-bisphosphate 7-phosphatase [Legionella sp.]|nr:D-glycero-beta-D-manno-heptose 1,7-bisphosphate 7-phosphatase [Legionella sp.]
MNDKKYIILDRDGVINYDSLAYIKTVEEFKPIPGSMEAIAQLTAAGYSIGLATNQSGVSRGLYTEETLQAIHKKMLNLVHSYGGNIEAIEYCLHLPVANCNCRKPKPGMLLNLAKRLNCSLNSIAFVGDRVSDIQAAIAVAATPILIRSIMTDLCELENYPQVQIYNSLHEYVQQMLNTP